MADGEFPKAQAWTGEAGPLPLRNVRIEGLRVELPEPFVSLPAGFTLGPTVFEFDMPPLPPGPLFPEGLARVLDPPPSDGPPWVHTISQPEPVPVLDADGRPVLDGDGGPVMDVPLLPSLTIEQIAGVLAAEEALSLWGAGGRPDAETYREFTRAPLFTGVLSYLKEQQ